METEVILVSAPPAAAAAAVVEPIIMEEAVMVMVMEPLAVVEAAAAVVESIPMEDPMEDPMDEPMEEPMLMLPASMVPFCSFAIATNFSWDLSAVGLMLKAMPLPQWPTGTFCRQ